MSRQAERFGPGGPGVNGRMTPRQVRKYCALRPESAALLKGVMEELSLSARPMTRSSASPGPSPTSRAPTQIEPQHVGEAVGYRSLDRGVWTG